MTVFWRRAGGFRRGLWGEERRGWFNPGLDDSGWASSGLREALKGEGTVWLRRRFQYKPGENTVSPLALRIGSLGAKCKIFLNGELIGRFMSIGPQRDFYMPEPLMKKENLLAIAVENYGEPVVNPTVQILPYYVAKKTEVWISF